MHYATAKRILDDARATGAVSVTLGISEGVFTVTLAEAFDGWEILAPGEPFTIHEVHWHPYPLADRAGEDQTLEYESYGDEPTMNESIFSDEALASMAHDARERVWASATAVPSPAQREALHGIFGDKAPMFAGRADGGLSAMRVTDDHEVRLYQISAAGEVEGYEELSDGLGCGWHDYDADGNPVE